MNTMLICDTRVVGSAMERAVSCKILITETWVRSEALRCICGAESALVGLPPNSYLFPNIIIPPLLPAHTFIYFRRYINIIIGFFLLFHRAF
jgi:hypothetical protein